MRAYTRLSSDIVNFMALALCRVTLVFRPPCHSKREWVGFEARRRCPASMPGRERGERMLLSTPEGALQTCWAAERGDTDLETRGLLGGVGLRAGVPPEPIPLSKQGSKRETERERETEKNRPRKRQRERARDRETERQRDRETERQRDRETEREDCSRPRPQAKQSKERERERQTDGQKERKTERRRERQRESARQRDRETERKKDRKTERETERE